MLKPANNLKYTFIDSPSLLNCTNTDTYKDCHDNCLINCDFLKTWYDAGIAFIFFDALAIVLLALSVIDLLLVACNAQVLKKFVEIKFSGYLVLFAGFMHIIGYTIWVSLVKIKFFHTVYNNWPLESEVAVKAEAGDIVGVYFFTWLPLFACIMIIVGKALNNAENPKDQTLDTMLR